MEFLGLLLVGLLFWGLVGRAGGCLRVMLVAGFLLVVVVLLTVIFTGEVA